MLCWSDKVSKNSLLNESADSTNWVVRGNGSDDIGRRLLMLMSFSFKIRYSSFFSLYDKINKFSARLRCLYTLFPLLYSRKFNVFLSDWMIADRLLRTGKSQFALNKHCAELLSERYRLWVDVHFFKCCMKSSRSENWQNVYTHSKLLRDCIVNHATKSSRSFGHSRAQRCFFYGFGHEKKEEGKWRAQNNLENFHTLSRKKVKFPEWTMKKSPFILWRANDFVTGKWTIFSTCERRARVR